MGLVQSLNLGGIVGFCFLDCDFIMGLHLPNCSCMLDFCLFDGLGSLDVILAHCNFSVPCQLSSVGVQGGPSDEQLLQGCIHLPSLDRHVASALGGLGLWTGGNAGHVQSFWYGRQGGGVTDLDSFGGMLQCNLAWGCLWRGGHGIRDDQFHSLKAE